MTQHALIAMETTADSVAEAPESVCRVLVVDDDRDSADFLCKLLTLEGHQARCAYSGASAIALAADFRPHAVLLDIGMPQMNGYEVLRRMKARETRARFIALSGLGGGADRKLALSVGFDAYIVKPISVDELSRQIKLAAV